MPIKSTEETRVEEDTVDLVIADSGTIIITSNTTTTTKISGVIRKASSNIINSGTANKKISSVITNNSNRICSKT